MNRLPPRGSTVATRPPRGVVRQPAAPRAGFTLVEMLVSVALVILMMTLFAAIFQMATGAMSTQRGLAENDQRSRLVLNALRNDLNRRTMKLVLPFAANEDVTQPEAQLPLRQGYFYIREGDPDDPTDDLLQLTVAVKPGEDPFYGVWGRRQSASGSLGDLLLVDASNNLRDASNRLWPNQPEFDDGAADINHAASSPRAEVSYFLRNGALYRRVLLIRQPSSPVGATNGQPLDGTEPLKTDLFERTGYQGAYENFYTSADFSAYYDTTNFKLKFHGTASLDNGGSAFQNALAIPNFRFGHDVLKGLPREVSANGFYIGRFTQEETSWFDQSDRSIGFGYPGRITSNSPNPYDPANGAVNYDPDRGVVREFAGGWRASEDLLMTNVHRFDIKVWDDAASVGPDGAAGRVGIDDDRNAATDTVSGNPDPGELGYPDTDDGDFRDLGHNGATGFYRAAVLGNAYYCQADVNGRMQYRFDTWHPKIDLAPNGTGDSLLDRPPFRAALRGPDGQPGWANFSDDGNLDTRNPVVNGPVTDDLNELGWPGSDDIVLPLKAIQIKITFFEPTTRTLREVTLLFPLQAR